MIKSPHIYAVIIGSEILDRRREDKHFDFLSRALEKIGFCLFASLSIKDDKKLIESTYEMIKNDEEAIMFSFGGIGSTPDDLTRQLSANIFSDARLYRHSVFEKDIIERLGKKAYPHSIKMADLPKDAKLLFNPINNMSGFHLQNRFFFMPGFPEMAQAMIKEILAKYLPPAKQAFYKGFIAQCGEGRIQELMLKVNKEVELSSLPMMDGGMHSVEFSLTSFSKEDLEHDFSLFIDFLNTQEIEYRLL